ncbi:MAG: transporter substrate-binding domain-containing protein [Clostridiales bacterium]|nr:transporter substrate-binding domain-containing protein [Clostridiales bacterium]
MKKILSLVILLFILLTGCASQTIDFSDEEVKWMKDHPVIYIGPDPVFGPIELIDSEGRYKGIAADYIEWIEKNTPLHFEIIKLDNWGKILEALKSKDIDMLGAATYTNERSEYMLFSDVFINMPNIIVTRADYNGRAKLEELAGESVVVMDDYASEDYLEEFYPDINLVPVQSIEEGLSMVSLGNKDYMLATVGQVSFYLENSTITNLKMSGDVELTFDLSFAVRRDYDELINILNKALYAMPSSEKEKIYQKWISIEVESLINKRMFYSLLALLGFVFVIVLVISFFNRILKNQVFEKTQALHKELHERQEVEKKLEELNKSLENIVKERTNELQDTLYNLKSLQSELIETEKMASLSRVLVSISHKLNTPIGNGITTTSYMEKLLRTLAEDLEKNELSKSNLIKSLEDINYSVGILVDELFASKHFLDQIKTVSQLEFDKTKVSINLIIYLRNLENSYQNQLKQQHIEFIVDCSESIYIDTSETILDNIFRVLIENSIVHGLSKMANGVISISVTKDDGFIWIVYKDNGIGIDERIIQRIYEPLFTTSMGTTSGFGLNILYNTIKTYLNGEIEILSNEKNGVVFKIKIAAH